MKYTAQTTAGSGIAGTGKFNTISEFFLISSSLICFAPFVFLILEIVLVSDILSYEFFSVILHAFPHRATHPRSLNLEWVSAFGRLLSRWTGRAAGRSTARRAERTWFAELIVTAGQAVGRSENAGNEVDRNAKSSISPTRPSNSGATLTTQVSTSGGTATASANAGSRTTASRCTTTSPTGGSSSNTDSSTATARAAAWWPNGRSGRLALVNGTTTLLMLDGIEALYGVDDLDGRTDADAIDNPGDAATLLVAALRPNVVVLVLPSVGFTDAIARTFPNGTALIRFGDLDGIWTAGRWADVSLGAHADAFDAAVDAKTALVASVVPPVSFDVLDVLVDAGLGQMLAFVHRAALAFGNVTDGNASV